MREKCVLDELYEQEGQIGDTAKIIEVDEMKISKQNNERGRLIDGRLIVGMIERNSNNPRI